MNKFFCYGKQAICEKEGNEICNECEYLNNKGGKYVEVPEPTRKIKVMLDPGAIMPTRAHRKDAGLDLFSPVRQVIRANDWVSIDTGVHVQTGSN